jgi:hypothetical protein
MRDNMTKQQKWMIAPDPSDSGTWLYFWTREDLIEELHDVDGWLDLDDVRLEVNELIWKDGEFWWVGHEQDEDIAAIMSAAGFVLNEEEQYVREDIAA